MAKVVADQRARGGGPGRPVLYVLIASMILLVCLVGAGMFWAGNTSPPPSSQATSPSASSSQSSKAPADNPAYPAPATRP